MSLPRASNSTVSSATFVRRLVAGVLLINLFVIGLVVLSLWQSRLQYEERASVTTQNLTLVFDHYIGGSIHKIDVVLLNAADEIENQIARGGIDRRALDRFLDRRSGRLPELEGVRMADALGNIEYGSDVHGEKPVNIADRDYFIRLLNGDTQELVISKPLVSRVIEKWVLILARRVNRPDGSFAGIVYGVIPLDNFLKIFNSIDVGRHGSITLRDRELAVIARYPGTGGIGAMAGRKEVAGRLREFIRSGRETGTFKALAPIDRVERTYAYRKISDYPLFITVGLATSDYLSVWRRELVIMCSVVALFFLLTFFGSRRFLNDWKRKKTAVQALIEQEQKYRTLFEESKDTILISDPLGRILDINKAGIGLFGYTKEEIVELDPAMLYCCTEERKRLWDALLISESVDDFEVEMKKKNGDTINVHLSVAITRDENGKIIGHRGIARDMTERKRLERQLMQAQKMESIGLLAGGVAHDFNNLLTAISGYGQMLQDSITEEDESSRDSVEQILRASERAAELTKSLLAFSRKQVIHPKPVQVESIISDMANLIKRIIGEDIELRLSFSEPTPPVMADRGQIEQVLMNLATNARDAMPHGGHMQITTEVADVREGSETQYDVAKPGKYVRISVADTGEGIEEKNLGRIFEPFFTTKDIGKGTGLGLAMIYGAVKQNNGSIHVDSIQGRGTTFHIMLPAMETAGDEEIRTAFASSAAGGTETILLAEDEEIVRVFTEKILARAGYTVISAVDGNDAVRKFGECPENISLILSDVIMPGKNGMEILEEVRKIKSSIGVLFISGYTANVMHEKGIFKDGMDIIAKPFEKDELLRKVREILDAG